MPLPLTQGPLLFQGSCPGESCVGQSPGLSGKSPLRQKIFLACLPPEAPHTVFVPLGIYSELSLSDRGLLQTWRQLVWKLKREGAELEDSEKFTSGALSKPLKAGEVIPPC